VRLALIYALGGRYLMKKVISIILASMMFVSVCLMSACGTSNAKNNKYKIIHTNIAEAEEQYAIGFRKEDGTLRNEIQKILVEMKNDGAVSKIATTWFGSDITNIPTTFSAAEATDDSLSKVKAAGTLILGLDDTFPPMGFRNDDDEIVGFDIDLAKEVCTRLGVTLKLQPIIWDQNITELNNRNIDCIWNGMSITDDRKVAMNLSESYMQNEMVLVVLNGSSYATLEDLAGKKIAVQSGSTAQEILEKSEFAKTVKEILPFESNTMALVDLKANGVDAVFVDVIVANYLIAQEK